MEAKLLMAERFVDRETGCSYRYVRSKTEYFRPHYHDYYELFYMIEGEAIHLVNGAELPLRERDLVFVRPSDTHDYARCGATEFSMLNLTFTRETAESLFSYLGDGFPSKRLLMEELPPAARLDREEAARFNAEMEEICVIGEFESAKRKTALRSLLFRLMTQFFGSYERHSSVPFWLSELCAAMKENGNFIVGAPRMFALSEKSREHVCRSMRKYYKMSVTEYVNLLRLNYVAGMLKNSNHKITDIVLESGFEHIGWASELFLARYGVTMSAYRAEAAAKPSRDNNEKENK